MTLLRKILVVLIITGLILTIFPVWNVQDNTNYVINDVKTESKEDFFKDIEDDDIGGSRGARIAKVASTKKAAEISDVGMETARLMLERAWTENITEAEIIRAIDMKMVELGSSSMLEAFGLLVVSGNDTGESGGHGPSENDDEVNQILPGEVVFVDIGARYNGYTSDITRTFFMGEPTQQMREVYQIILDAQEAAFAPIRHGTICGDVDKAARKVITDAGYGEYFSHCVGHGIGLDVHVPPTVCSDSMTPLSKARDDIITIEPGIYIEDDFGIRTEDDVIVDWFGYEIITFYPKNIEHMIIHPPENVSEPKEQAQKKWWETDKGKQAITGGSLGIIIIITVAFFLRKRKRERIEE
ncbi:MAG: M24 family metallopeptidase [Thermoplasmata archaeon]|nr:MAG: M24 family metallopeptidase [Thermoplasmata archaeon]